MSARVCMCTCCYVCMCCRLLDNWIITVRTYSIMHACAVHCVCVIMNKKKGFGALKAVGTQHMRLCMCMCMYVHVVIQHVS